MQWSQTGGFTIETKKTNSLKRHVSAVKLSILTWDSVGGGVAFRDILKCPFEEMTT